ncbi:hypothetical protein [Loigolactobacillus coryniformis]|uniref:Uncharacterized protein n=1 Tax=Loigolactobacillus coryniformis subsp. torquens DSM 20004 = KCTC 3535 TaxID=1423822 RepID=A0A2D1KSG8_9LACO|nr:hypothetical protein [Loigolactobacillus coryniformis]ATO45070.1 hypothetical protein LC20004_14135 [Loigolactobacillus coryniformis subsp. torquens DSM 20004 = KCTC 3535]ATO45126.1 hypothetical protein LC20004_14445 [Loigolactobacillus coryniformis subsp. torquens DSM 20004 = KCTC 3535]
MTREQLLDFLMGKRQATAGVADAQQNLSADQEALVNGKKKFRKINIVLIILAVLSGVTMDTIVDFGGPIVFGGLAIALWIYRKNHYIQPASEAIEKDKIAVQQALEDPVYVQGADGFPEKFYNYWDALRLWKLVNENRATSLQEAFNLLETQHFQEDQLSMQAEMNSLQADIATNSKIAAVASTVTAFNTTRK